MEIWGPFGIEEGGQAGECCTGSVMNDAPIARIANALGQVILYSLQTPISRIQPLIALVSDGAFSKAEAVSKGADFVISASSALGEAVFTTWKVGLTEGLPYGRAKGDLETAYLTHRPPAYYESEKRELESQRERQRERDRPCSLPSGWWSQSGGG